MFFRRRGLLWLGSAVRYNYIKVRFKGVYITWTYFRDWYLFLVFDLSRHIHVHVYYSKSSLCWTECIQLSVVATIHCFVKIF